MGGRHWLAIRQPTRWRQGRSIDGRGINDYRRRCDVLDDDSVHLAHDIANWAPFAQQFHGRQSEPVHAGRFYLNVHLLPDGLTNCA